LYIIRYKNAIKFLLDKGKGTIVKIKYHEPLGSPNNKQDPLPENWRELSAIAGAMPENFGIVEKDKLYRSAIVWPHQVNKLYKDYKISHMIVLIDGAWLEQFYDDWKITIHQFPYLQRRELTFERVKDIVRLINSLKEPSLVCCLKGKTKTGMVAAGYEILNGRKNKLQAIADSMRYGNLNISSFSEMRRYDK